jgi:WD40 repeat protein
MSASGDYRTHMYDPRIGLPPPATLVTPPQYNHSSTIQGSNPIYAIAVSSDSRLIASGDDSGVVQIWDSRSHERVGKAGKHDGTVNSVCFSPDSRWLVSGSRDKSIRMWDCRTGEAMGSPLLGHTGDVNSVCTDGQRIISGSDDKTIRIWIATHVNSSGSRSKCWPFVSLLLFPTMVALLQEWGTMYVSLISRPESK